ncbi:SDR family NAD(P)-dependent oxidoreductase [Jiangella asiatica]|uniref:SDR family NAD(P)-dependent oxidoreductase n=1 Tax=Jiangella asiatica TaxID=2530372 RepID=UPI0013A5CDEC|nr:SDR family NAD(P)-dependent oxidoreductase [Jiangella asiatica]
MPERTAIVTGAGTGLGRAIAARLLRDGFRVTLTGPDGVQLTETARLAPDHGELATIVVGDLRQPDVRREVIARATAGPGILFGLVNNAGLSAVEPLLDESVATWRAIFEVNLDAAFFLSQAAIEHMRPHGTGRIVNIGSIYGVVGFNNHGYGARAPMSTPGDRGPVRQSAYDASKGALIQLTRTLATAVGPWGITVNTVSPGHIPWANEAAGTTPVASAASGGAKPAALGQRVDPAILTALAEQVPLRRTGRAAEVAGPVSFLLSEDAAYITGQNIIVDGGATVW